MNPQELTKIINQLQGNKEFFIALFKYPHVVSAWAKKSKELQQALNQYSIFFAELNAQELTQLVFLLSDGDQKNSEKLLQTFFEDHAKLAENLLKINPQTLTTLASNWKALKIPESPELKEIAEDCFLKILKRFYLKNGDARLFELISNKENVIKHVEKSKDLPDLFGFKENVIALIKSEHFFTSINKFLQFPFESRDQLVDFSEDDKQKIDQKITDSLAKIFLEAKNSDEDSHRNFSIKPEQHNAIKNNFLKIIDEELIKHVYSDNFTLNKLTNFYGVSNLKINSYGFNEKWVQDNKHKVQADTAWIKECENSCAITYNIYLISDGVNYYAKSEAGSSEMIFRKDGEALKKAMVARATNKQPNKVKQIYAKHAVRKAKERAEREQADKEQVNNVTPINELALKENDIESINYIIPKEREPLIKVNLKSHYKWIADKVQFTDTDIKVELTPNNLTAKPTTSNCKPSFFADSINRNSVESDQLSKELKELEAKKDKLQKKQSQLNKLIKSLTKKISEEKKLILSSVNNSKSNETAVLDGKFRQQIPNLLTVLQAINSLQARVDKNYNLPDMLQKRIKSLFSLLMRQLNPSQKSTEVDEKAKEFQNLTFNKLDENFLKHLPVVVSITKELLVSLTKSANEIKPNRFKYILNTMTKGWAFSRQINLYNKIQSFCTQINTCFKESTLLAHADEADYGFAYHAQISTVRKIYEKLDKKLQLNQDKINQIEKLSAYQKILDEDAFKMAEQQKEKEKAAQEKVRGLVEKQNKREQAIAEFKQKMKNFDENIVQQSTQQINAETIIQSKDDSVTPGGDAVIQTVQIPEKIVDESALRQAIAEQEAGREELQNIETRIESLTQQAAPVVTTNPAVLVY